MPSSYYEQSVELGKQFQLNNSSWGGDDCKNYHNQFSDWVGPDLYWWFRNTEHPINDWYRNTIYKDNV
jgi:hypothetical protein